jgi:hypothetical protein
MQYCENSEIYFFLQHFKSNNPLASSTQSAAPTLQSALAAFVSCCGESKGSYYFEVICSYENKDKTLVHRSMTVKFLPTNVSYYISQFQIDTEGAWKERGKINSPNNPLTEDKMKLVSSDLRYLCDNIEELPFCNGKHGVSHKRHYHNSLTGQYFVHEKLKIHKKDFENFKDMNKAKTIVLVEDGSYKY